MTFQKYKNSCLYLGDCIEVLQEDFLDNTISSVVCDPPYGLSFMGKSWDHGVPGVPFWKEILRVAKPGAYLLAFGGTRTFHRLAVAIENAGWEIRDTLMWVYGSGFPKSLNIGKDIDRILGYKREIIGKQSTQIGSVLKSKEGPGPGGNKEATKNRFTGNVLGEAISPPACQWEGWGTALKPAWEPIILARKPLGEKTVAANVLKYGTGGLNIDGCRVMHQSESDRASATPQGKATGKSGALAGGTQHDGERTEFDRPDTCKGRFPANLILSHSPECKLVGMKKVKSSQGSNFEGDRTSNAIEVGLKNRIPSQIPNEETVEDWECVDGCPVKLLNEQSGVLKSGFMKKGTPYPGGNVYGKQSGVTHFDTYADKGGASRFFYCAKASKKERSQNCEDIYTLIEGVAQSDLEEIQNILFGK